MTNLLPADNREDETFGCDEPFCGCHEALEASEHVIDISAAADPDKYFEPLLTAEEAAKLLCIHKVTLLRFAREGRVPHKRIGRRVAFRASDLNDWLSSGYTDSAVRAAEPEGEGA